MQSGDPFPTDQQRSGEGMAQAGSWNVYVRCGGGVYVQVSAYISVSLIGLIISAASMEL